EYHGRPTYYTSRECPGPGRGEHRDPMETAMFALLPQRFDPARMGGPRSRAFPLRSDAFQQLVGDGLKASVGQAAYVVSTKGQDGSIDAGVRCEHAGGALFSELPGPFIVECKDHDDALPGWADNVESGWSAVKDKLKRASQRGWDGLYAPWKNARGYAYCV